MIFKILKNSDLFLRVISWETGEGEVVWELTFGGTVIKRIV